jgi:hypothetical protein
MIINLTIQAVIWFVLYAERCKQGEESIMIGCQFLRIAARKNAENAVRLKIIMNYINGDYCRDAEKSV